jgi:hypothetical protein
MIQDLVPALTSLLGKLFVARPAGGTAEGVPRLVHSLDLGFSRSMANRLDQLARDDAAIAVRVRSEYPLSRALAWMAAVGWLLMAAALFCMMMPAGGFALLGRTAVAAVGFLLGAFLLLIRARVTEIVRHQRKSLTDALRRYGRRRLDRSALNTILTSIRLYGPNGPTNKEFALLLIRGMQRKRSDEAIV